MSEHDTLIEPFDELEMNTIEYGHLLVTTHHTSPTFLVTIPKLMGGMSTGPSSSSSGVNDKFIVNDVACKPTIASSMTRKGYVTVPRQPDRSYSELADIAGYLHPGTRMQIVCMDKNPRDRWLNSTLP